MSNRINGLGDLVEYLLKKVGITEERVKRILGIKECGCKNRKDFLNKLFSWRKDKG